MVFSLSPFLSSFTEHARFAEFIVRDDPRQPDCPMIHSDARPGYVRPWLNARRHEKPAIPTYIIPFQIAHFSIGEVL